MLASFLIMLREGLEAALIVGIIAGYLGRTGRSGWLPLVWIGIFLAIAAALFVGAGIQLARAEFPQRMQELFEALVGLIAVVMLSMMVLWMRRAGGAMARGIETSVEAAMGQGAGAWALTVMVFLAVAREGLESVFFLLAIFQQTEGASAPLGAALGVLVAGAVGYALYRGAVRIDLRAFFRWTGLFLLIVAAGLLANAVRALHEAGLWNHLQHRVWDLGGVLPVSGPVGAALAGVFGYDETATLGQVLAWALFLSCSMWLFLRPRRVAV